VFKNKKNKREENFVNDEIVVDTISQKSEEKVKTIKDSNQEVKQERADKIEKSSISMFPEIENGFRIIGKEDREEALRNDEKIFETSVCSNDEKDVLASNNQDFVAEHIVDKEPLYTKEDIEEEISEDSAEDIAIFDEIVKEGIKKDINEYFEEGKKKNRKLMKTKEKKKSKRQLKIEREFVEIKDEEFFIFEGEKYRKIEDFIKYLDEHYKEIDKIAQKVLTNEHFYEWVSKSSGVFDESLKKFKEIKEKIEK
jgi:hypothetical protein